MLTLFSSPTYSTCGQLPRSLPATVPAALLVVLATQGGWVVRAQLALIFWPEVAPADALHHLRVNLHRARSLLAGWGQPDALQAERSRVRLALHSDVAQLRMAQAQGDTTGLQPLNPAHWLQGWCLPGYDGFAQWCDDTAAQLHAQWLAASRSCMPTARPLPGTPPALALGSQSQPSAAPPGREAELRRLLASPAPALLLLGEPGAGKTTLLRAAYPQAACLRGLEGLHAMPYRALLEVLREQLALLARALREPSHPLRPYRLDLARVLPELAPDEPLPPLDALTAQTRLVEALARAFEALTPVLLVDDLQWCDSATVEWLLLLAHSGRLRWRAAARRHELPQTLLRALQSLRSAARLEEMDLPPLSRSAVAQACAQRWPQQAFSDAQLDRLHLLSGGNAFLMGELVAVGDTGGQQPGADTHPGDADCAAPVPQTVARLVQARVQALPELARQAVEAAAIFVQPVPAQALCHLAGLPPGRRAGDATGHRAPDAGAAPPGEPRWADGALACQQAVAAGLLVDSASGLACRHDLIRQTVARALPAAQRAALHRHAALWLAAVAPAHGTADALSIAEHWRAAGEPQTALAWCHRGAEQLKARGRFDEARALWHEVADNSLDAAQALRARLELAACDLFEDLNRGEAALAAVHAQLAAVADDKQRCQIEGRVLSALVDNRVFAGDISQAQQHATRLRELLPALPEHERVHALEVLIELAMRQPDIPAAWACLAQLRTLAPQQPTLLSFEGQIHWFGGQVQAAHDALARLLLRHPDYCRGITVENDLAVMLHALGRIEEAEAMARRSLQSWAGVAHTETLSLLVLGAVLTSAGRHIEADTALLRAQALAREQASPGFEAEALVRRARLLLQWERAAEAQQALEQAVPLLAGSPEPLRVSQLALAQVLAAAANGLPWPEAAVARLHAVANGNPHPLVQVRVARVAHALAQANGKRPAAHHAAAEMARHARRAGLQEPLAEALLLQSEAAANPARALDCARAAQDLAARQGLHHLRQCAASQVTLLGG
jgi:tetratricopeptide (TPR) repeat protein